ncbi:hypothetical protein [Sphingopyxis sp. KK2]|uniref:hypothetical protein n=1 Tax=Sphingopyxis sp. KK2 TaxID=1855727 RepID=UPI001181A2BD|nr:hypothetical protein [Sphingopyxis sp. KK2]
MKLKNVMRHSTNVIATFAIGIAVCAIIADTISQISRGTISDLPFHILGGLAFIGFMLFMRHAILLHVDTLD